MRKIAVFLFILTCFINNYADNATVPGAIQTPYPTIVNLAVVWLYSGDDNHNGSVSVRYRQTSENEWYNAQPLRNVPFNSNEGFSWESQHSGSIFNLKPNTSYTIELNLNDPDGGSETQTVVAATRPVPKPFNGGNNLKASPNNLGTIVASAQAGDIILLDSGNYGDFTMTKDGLDGKPIVFRSAISRKATFSNIDIQQRKYIHLEGLSITGLDEYGMIRMRGTVGCVVRYCAVTATGKPGSGITAYAPSGATMAYIADNDVIRNSAWEDAAVGANGDNEGEGIQICGPGNVICHNKVKGFRDCISFFEDTDAENQQCNDIYNNDIEIGLDDGIEADFSMGNCRIFRNRLTNCFVGMSSQPSLGRPTYFIRNVMYNIIYAPFKLHRGSIGDIAWHNTTIKCGDAFACYAGRTWSQAQFFNNIFIGGSGGGTFGGYSNGTGRIAELRDADSTCNFNADGYASTGISTFSGKIGQTAFFNLQELRNLTTEKRAVQVSMDIFASAIAFPATGPFPEQPIPDLRPKSFGAHIDTGIVLANVNDRYTGKSPDLGAYEFGDSLPIYGPRPYGIDEGTAIIPQIHESIRPKVHNCQLIQNVLKKTICIVVAHDWNPVTIEVFTPNGRQFDRVDNMTGNRVIISTMSFPKGIYLIQLRNKDGQTLVMKAMQLN